MSKRTPGFERRDRDAYPTPLAAVAPLIPYLRGVRTFAEPCCGGGELGRHLELFGLVCVYAGDITTGQDALTLGVTDIVTADAIITNPPYARPLMHAMIAHLGQLRPTGLLLESDWASTKQGAPFMAHCSDIVAIGRVKWIADSPHTGKDNFAWFRFDARHKSGPILHWRDRDAPLTARCTQCGRAYQRQRSSARFCSATCRQRAHRTLSVTLA